MLKKEQEKMKMKVSEKTVVQKKNNDKKNRFLIIVNVLGSSGPLKFLVNENDKVSAVIDSSLKLYARGGRLPVLGSDTKNFLLYPSNAGSEALNSDEEIGVCGGRNFVLCKKQSHPQMTEARSEMVSSQRGGRGWKTWLNRSFKILSH